MFCQLCFGSYFVTSTFRPMECWKHAIEMKAACCSNCIKLQKKNNGRIMCRSVMWFRLQLWFGWKGHTFAMLYEGKAGWCNVLVMNAISLKSYHVYVFGLLVPYQRTIFGLSARAIKMVFGWYVSTDELDFFLKVLTFFTRIWLFSRPWLFSQDQRWTFISPSLQL